jgi:hypothetical protein
MNMRVSEEAIRRHIREMMSSPSVGWESTGNRSDSPSSVSAVVDPSAALTDPSNSNFKPQNRKELKAALSTTLEDIADDDASQFYDAFNDLIEKNKVEDEKMKDSKKVEETIRLAIRKMLSEAELPPVKKIPMGVHGGEWMKAHEKRRKDLEKTLTGMSMDSDAEEMTRADAPAAGRGRKNVMQTDIGGASFKQIAQELGYASESGAKQAAEKAMAKVQFASSMDQDELAILTLTAMNDYIDFLNKSGELTPADVQLMKDHPNIVSELDGFREFLDKYVKREMKGKGIAEAAEKKDEVGPKCPECGKNMKLRDKKEYEANGGKGYPRICTRCAEEE